MEYKVIKHILKNKGFTYNAYYHWYEKKLNNDSFATIPVKKTIECTKEDFIHLLNNPELLETVEEYRKRVNSPEWLNRRRP